MGNASHPNPNPDIALTPSNLNPNPDITLTLTLTLGNEWHFPAELAPAVPAYTVRDEVSHTLTLTLTVHTPSLITSNPNHNSYLAYITPSVINPDPISNLAYIVPDAASLTLTL